MIIEKLLRTGKLILNKPYYHSFKENKEKIGGGLAVVGTVFLCNYAIQEMKKSKDTSILPFMVATKKTLDNQSQFIPPAPTIEPRSKESIKKEKDLPVIPIQLNGDMGTEESRFYLISRR